MNKREKRKKIWQKAMNIKRNNIPKNDKGMMGHLPMEAIKKHETRT